MNSYRGMCGLTRHFKPYVLEPLPCTTRRHSSPLPCVCALQLLSAIGEGVRFSTGECRTRPSGATRTGGCTSSPIQHDPALAPDNEEELAEKTVTLLTSLTFSS